jgi:PST family polysaccharide transporter
LFTERWKEIYHFTKHLIGSTVLTRIADQGDKFILGKFLGLDKLGIYNIASQLAELVSNQVVMLSNNILSSVLPKYVDDKERFYKHYISFIKAFSFFIFPVLAVMFVTAKPVVLFLYGDKWVEAIVPMRILLIYAALRSVTSSYGSVMNSLHLNKKSFIVIAIYTPIHLLSSIIGSFYGVVGIAVAICTVKAIFLNWNIKQMMEALKQPFIKWYRELYPYFASSVLVSVVSFLLLSLFSQLSFILFMSIAVIVFAALYYLFFRTLFTKELQHVSGFIGLTFPRLQRYFNLVFSI